MELELPGVAVYIISLLTVGGIYGVIALGLNLQWGYAGLFNAGIAGFFATGAYASAILTSAKMSGTVGGFSLPVPLGITAAMVFSGLVAWPVGRICLRLRGDYLAIATIGIAEILRLFFKNELWLTGGVRGITTVPRPFEDLPGHWAQVAFLALTLTMVGLVYVVAERAGNSPWGRVMRAIRENEMAAESVGKDVERFRLQAFVVGSMIMGLGGAMWAHSTKYIGPEATEPLLATFLVWAMLIAGGSGNNRGAILGAMVIWAVWSTTSILTDWLIADPDWQLRAAYIRVFLIGLLLQVILQFFPGGLMPERPPPPLVSPKRE